MRGLEITLGERQSVIPPGQYRAVVADIERKPGFGKKEIFTFMFEVADGPYRGIRLRAFANAQYEKFSEYTKIRRWLAAVVKLEDQSGITASLQAFFGKVLLVQVEGKCSKKTGNAFSNVTEILGVACDLNEIDSELHTAHPSMNTSLRGADQGSKDHYPEPKPTALERPHQARRSDATRA